VDSTVIGATIGGVATVIGALIVAWVTLHQRKLKPEPSPGEEWLHVHVDDVLVEQGETNIKLDVRVRNSGKGVVNFTRAELLIYERLPYLEVIRPTAVYSLLLADTHSEISIAHVLQPNEVDRFIIRVVFAEWNTSDYGFMGQLFLDYNGEFTAESGFFEISSTPRAL
jgi:hypothetical protein